MILDILLDTYTVILSEILSVRIGTPRGPLTAVYPGGFGRYIHREFLDTFLDLLRASQSRHFGYNFWFNKGVTIAKIWIHF